MKKDNSRPPFNKKKEHENYKEITYKFKIALVTSFTRNDIPPRADGESSAKLMTTGRKW